MDALPNLEVRDLTDTTLCKDLNLLPKQAGTHTQHCAMLRWELGPNSSRAMLERKKLPMRHLSSGTRASSFQRQVHLHHFMPSICTT